MGQSVQFQLGTTVFSYGEEMVQYAQYREKGEMLAVQASIKFIEQYRKYEDLDTFCKQGYEWGTRVLQNAVGQAVQCCVDAGHYDVNEDEFIAADTEKQMISPWAKAFGEVYKAYIDIESEKLSEEQRRELRKEARGRFVGGGFGLSNAIMASVEAGAVNMVTGAAHSVFNAIGNAMSSYSANRQKEAVYSSPEILSQLQEGLAESIRNVFEVLSFKVLELKPFGESAKELRRVASMMDNINHNRIPSDKVYGTLCQILQINPFIGDAYDAIWSSMKTFQDIRNFYLMQMFFGIARKRHEKEVLDSYRGNDSEKKTMLKAAVFGGNPDAAVRLAQENLKQGHADAAEELLLEAIALGNLDAMKLYIQGCEDRLFKSGVVKDLYLALSEANDYETILAMGRNYELGKYSFPKDIQKAIECYQRVEKSQAERFLKAEASLRLAKLYRQEKICEDWENLSISYYQKAMDYGELSAAGSLGRYAFDVGDYTKAFSYFCSYLGLDSSQTFKLDVDGSIKELQRPLDDSWSFYELGVLFDLGSVELKHQLGIKKSAKTKNNTLAANKRKSVVLYAKASERGCAEASFRCGQLYESGEGGEQNIAQAVKYYELALTQGIAAAASLRLAGIYGDADGELYDPEKELQYRTKAFDTGVTSEAMKLAELYEDAQNPFHDIRKTMEYYARAIEAGNRDAAHHMGWLCEGNNGVERNLELATQYYSIAARAKDDSAALRLGQLYENGDGLPVDQIKSAEWYRQAASLENQEANFPLGRKYHEGIGVEKNFVLAEDCYKKAIVAGNDEALMCLGDLYREENRLIDAENCYSQLAGKNSAEAAEKLKELQSGQALRQEKKQVKAEEDARRRAYERKEAVAAVKHKTYSFLGIIYNILFWAFVIGYALCAWSYYGVIGYNGSIIDFLWETGAMYLNFLFNLGSYLIHLVLG